jgi:hypothetical protein
VVASLLADCCCCPPDDRVNFVLSLTASLREICEVKENEWKLDLGFLAQTTRRTTKRPPTLLDEDFP